MDEARRAFAPWRGQHARPAWRPVTELGEGDVAASRFGGRPALRPGEPWPACAACGRPQTLFLQLDLDALPEGAGEFGGGLLQFFYCVECEQDGRGEPWRAFSDMHLFRRPGPPGDLVIGDPDEATDDWEPVEPLSVRHVTAWKPVEDLPAVAEAEGIRVEWAAQSGRGSGDARLHRVTWSDGGITFESSGRPSEVIDVVGRPAGGDKLGGWPAWVQSPQWPDCPKCGGRMRLLFQLGSNYNLDFMFGDAGTGHAFWCEGCDEFAFNWSCS